MDSQAQVTRVWEAYLEALYEYHCAQAMHQRYSGLAKVIAAPAYLGVLGVLVLPLVPNLERYGWHISVGVGMLAVAVMYLRSSFAWDAKSRREQDRMDRLNRACLGLKTEFDRLREGDGKGYSDERFGLYHQMLWDARKEAGSDELPMKRRVAIWMQVLRQVGVDPTPPESFLAQAR